MADGTSAEPAERGAEPGTTAGDGCEEESRSPEPESDPTLGAAVVTISSTRTIDTDEPSAEVVRALESAGHEIATRERIDTSHDAVQSTVSRLIDRDDTDFVVTAGGTGVDPTDVTIEAVSQILEREVPAFGQLFTHLAYERIGTRVVATRTLAGATDGVLVFCLPGHADAVHLAVEEIICPEVAHLVDEANGEADVDEASDVEDAVDEANGEDETDGVDDEENDET